VKEFVFGRAALMPAAIARTVVTIGTGLACLIAMPVLLCSFVSCVLGVGFLLVPYELRLMGRLADAERAWLARTEGREPAGPRRGRRWLPQLLREPATRRDVRWIPVWMLAGTVLGIVGLMATLLPVAALGAIGFWWVFPTEAPIRVIGNIPIDGWVSALTVGVVQLVVAVTVCLLLVPLLARGGMALSRVLLEPSERRRLAERVEALARTRAGIVDAHDKDLRRIERDLHDGTQAQLVALAMRLGMAERIAERDPATAVALVGQARAGAEEAMAELREVLRTMYPPILADRGLEGALTAVVARSALLAQLEVGALGEVPAPVEAAVYYVVTEALTNIAKHSGATAAAVRVDRVGDVLRAEVRDDGVGGAVEAGGSGLAGMRRRMEALDGTFTATSPVGGPTVIRVECPCGS
jgi:signal transduction histidine kinase